VVAAVAAVLAAISAARPPAPPTTAVLRTTRTLAAGAVLGAADVRIDRVPISVVPHEALVDTDSVAGKSLAGPVPEGQMLTELDLLGQRSRSDGRVVAPVRLADAEVADLLTVGGRVDVIAAGSQGERARLVAEGVRVVGLPRADPGSGLTQGDASGGALVLVEVDPPTATALAAAAADGALSVVLR